MVWSDPCTEVSQTAVFVLTNLPLPKRLRAGRQELHTEAMRLDPARRDAAEVPSLERGAKIVDRGEREEIVLWTILGSSQHVGWP